MPILWVNFKFWRKNEKSNTVRVTVSAEGITIDSKNENSFAIKLGQENDNYRIYGKYLNCDFDGDSMHVISLNYDKFFDLEQMKPFIGGTIGYLTYSENEDVDIDLSGLTYGLNLGISKDLSNNLSAEVGFNYIFTTATDDIKEGRQNIEIAHYFSKKSSTKIAYSGYIYANFP